MKGLLWLVAGFCALAACGSRPNDCDCDLLVLRAPTGRTAPINALTDVIHLDATGSYPVDVGPVALGQTNSTTVLLFNDGCYPITLLGAGAPPDAEFAYTAPVGTNIAPGQSLPIEMSFKAFSAGQKTTTFVIWTDSRTKSDLDFSLTGLGVN
jgi:hypothetical protein